MRKQCVLALLALLALAAGTAHAASLDAGAAAALRVEGAATADVRPWFCHNLDCPEYTVVNATEEYEVGNGQGAAELEVLHWKSTVQLQPDSFCPSDCRLTLLPSFLHVPPPPPPPQLRAYEKGVWVSTDVEAYAYALATNTGFRRLFEYIGGANGDAATVRSARRAACRCGAASLPAPALLPLPWPRVSQPRRMCCTLPLLTPTLCILQIPMTSPVRTKVSAAAGPFCKNSFTGEWGHQPGKSAKLRSPGRRRRLPTLPSCPLDRPSASLPLPQSPSSCRPASTSTRPSPTTRTCTSSTARPSAPTWAKKEAS